VIPCESLDEAIAIGNSVDYGLSASGLYPGNQPRVPGVCAISTPASFYVNAPTIGRRSAPAVRRHQEHRQRPSRSRRRRARVFSEWKSIYIDFSGKLQRAQIDTEQI